MESVMLFYTQGKIPQKSTSHKN